MRYFSVAEIAKKWDISERSVRNYCAQNRVDGAFIAGKTWKIPENAKKPVRTNKKKEQPVTLLDILKEQKINKYSGQCHLVKNISFVKKAINYDSLFCVMCRII